ncbi:MAG: NAD(P)H-dependent oxidoreductase [Sphingomonadales bacterium]|nr:NAD(P)H-dependent oxidoreductase [Sphingomonadales bacterium]MDE2170462.1 NAD(P)H-dependent oxidoreductase [Sphingomonadales bacterium]
MTPSIVCIGGTVVPGSTTERAMELAATAARGAGAQVRVFGGAYLGDLPHYRGTGHGPDVGVELVEAVRASDGVIIAAPGYHGTVSGLVKNALDYLEDLANDTRPYLHGRAVGLIATAYGDQATMSTMMTLRAIAHALRGWPTPMGATVRTYSGLFDEAGSCTDPKVVAQLAMVGAQVVQGARQLAGAPLS